MSIAESDATRQEFFHWGLLNGGRNSAWIGKPEEKRRFDWYVIIRIENILIKWGFVKGD
jgi:hypothetical protein